MKRILMSAAAAAMIVTSAVAPAAAAPRWWGQGDAAVEQTCRLPQWLCRLTGHEWDRPSTDCGTTGQPDATPDPDAGTDTAPDVDPTPDTDGAQSVTASALEKRVAELVNEQRAANGLSALTLSQSLCDGAREKSRDMKQNGYFSHESPTYGTPFAMMRALGITYQTAGENIAMGYSSAEAVMNAWMNSEGHRANILTAGYTHIGVGYVDGYWTQWFIS